MNAETSSYLSSLMRKLGRAVSLQDSDQALLNGMIREWRPVRTGTILMREGEPTTNGYLLASGWALRKRHLAGGGRQIFNFMLPGDLSEPGVFATNTADHTIEVLTDSVVGVFHHESWFSIFAKSSRLAVALWCNSAHEDAVLKEHIVALGRRDPRARVYYILWETWRRLRAVGLAEGNRFPFPITREVFADTLGMSPRHLLRTLTELNADGCVRLDNAHVDLIDPDRLPELADCDDPLIRLDEVSQSIRKVFAAGIKD